MALIKCPECGKEISEYAKSCPNCGFPVICTNFKFKIDLSGNQDVFGFYIAIFNKGKFMMSTRKISFDSDYGGSYEINYFGLCDAMLIVFEEHLKYRKIQFGLFPGRDYYLQIKEVDDPYDEYTYAENFEFSHPDFIYREMNPNLIGKTIKLELSKEDVFLFNFNLFK